MNDPPLPESRHTTHHQLAAMHLEAEAEADRRTKAMIARDSLADSIETLRRYNQWRRGDDSDMLNPRVIGKAIDAIIQHYDNANAHRSSDPCSRQIPQTIDKPGRAGPGGDGPDLDAGGGEVRPDYLWQTEEGE